MDDALNCLGAFQPELVQDVFVEYPAVPPPTIEAAARLAATAVGRSLGPVYGRGPWQAQPGDRSFTWR
ncbi:MAG: hypothetical protein M3Z13_00475, partial [Candidatus Dormibacteraeota bacterium]|nr:hypothetical protein [Candidatus Dormibacteraeota bacterium]